MEGVGECLSSATEMSPLVLLVLTAAAGSGVD